MGLRLLGGLTPASFLSEYWQKKPMLVRQAVPGFEAVRAPLFALESARRPAATRGIFQADAAASQPALPLVS